MFDNFASPDHLHQNVFTTLWGNGKLTRAPGLYHRVYLALELDACVSINDITFLVTHW